MKYFYLLLVLCFSVPVLSQNLVLNPSFETYNTCPMGPSELENANNWRHPFNNIVGDTCSTSDLFNSCNPLGSFGVGVPANLMGNEAAHSGNGYAGIILYEGFALVGCTSAFGSSWREYVEGELSSPLQAGEVYCVSFFVSLADDVKWATDDIGVYFSNSLVNVNCTSVSNSVLPFTPQLEYTGPDLDNATGWTELSWSYTATGGEQYITIGNFKNDANTSYSCANTDAFNPYSYYFIDDVSVELGECSASCSLDVSIESSQEDCVEGGTATITASTSGGSGNYSYNWGADGTGASISNLGNGTYTVLVSDNGNAACSATESITIDILAPVVAEAGPNDTICKGDQGQLIASGGGTYDWGSGVPGATLNAGPGSTTTYTVTITGANNCTDTDQATIVVYDIPAVIIEMANQAVCNNAAAIALSATPSGGTFSGDGVVNGNAFSPSVAGNGVHTVYYEMGDFEDCLGIDSVIFTVDLCTGVEENTIEDHISIYPNPTDGLFTVNSDNTLDTEITLEIVNVLGQKMMEPRTSNMNGMNQTFDLSGLSKGVYFLRVSSKEQTLNYKLLFE